MGGIEAVIFDYGGVLSTTPFDGIAEYERRKGYPERSLAQLLFGTGASPQGPTEDIAGHDWHLLETGHLTLAEFHERLVERSEAALGRPLDLADYAQFLRELGLGIHWMLIHRIRALRADGYRTAILTNNVKEWGDYWKRSIPLDLFDLIIDSCEVGLRKPDPAIFRLTCDRLGVAPEAAVFLDDTRRHVEGAREVGLHAILVRDPWAALDELDAILEAAAA